MDKKKPYKQAPKKVVKAEKPQRDYYIILLWLIILLVSFIRYRLISVPFERDEGEYGYIGNLFLHGFAPFKDAYSMKLPGTSFMYAVIMLIFGHTNTGVHMGVVFINAATMYFLYVAFKRIFNPFIGLATTSIFGFMAIGMVFDGFAAHATHFICFYSSIALFFLTDFMKSGKTIKVFLFGLFLGMAFLMKQQAIFLILFGAIFLFIYLKTEKKQAIADIIRRIFIMGVGVLIPYIIVLLIIICAGEFKVFWLWTVEYASKYEGVKSLLNIELLLQSSFGPAWEDYYYLWVLALAGVLVVYMSSYTRLQKLFAITYFLASGCVVSAGFYFRPHYFIVILPSVGLMTGMFIDFVVTQIRQRANILKSQYVSLVLLLGVLVFTVYRLRQYYFSSNPIAVCSTAYWGNPFTEAQAISKYISNDTKDTDKVAILGSEPEIYFYANRTAATGYLYMYPLVEDQPYNGIMQEQMIKEIEKNKPAYIVFCNIAFSWLVYPNTPRKIFEWGNTYTHQYYKPIGYAEFFNNKGWQLYYGEDMKTMPPQPDAFIIIFKRNAEAKI